ncbi:MAG: hypothetical protein SCH98_10415 [Deferrisomatales bacterium]|nr:hypothetical protein [Deferrisomatales bacterium]
MTAGRTVTVRHLRGLRAAATAAAGLSLAMGGLRLLASALTGADGWPFLGLSGTALTIAGAGIATLPLRLTTVLGTEGVSLGWALGRRRIPWAAVRRVVIGPLGSGGGERDPAAVTLLLESGEEVLYGFPGRGGAEKDEATAALLEAASDAAVRIDNVLAPEEERKSRARRWREARIKGWR